MQLILTDIPFGRNLQKIRLEKNMTQTKTVEKMQLMGSYMSRSTLGHIENGRRNIKVNDLRLLKMVFNVSYDAFFECADSSTKQHQQ